MRPPRRLKLVAQRQLETVLPLLEIVREAHARGNVPPAPETAARAASLGYHVSHDLRLRGVWCWCHRCGSHSRGERVGLLGKPCDSRRSLHGQGRATLRRIRRGLTPLAAHPEWGEAEEGSAVEAGACEKRRAPSGEFWSMWATGRF